MRFWCWLPNLFRSKGAVKNKDANWLFSGGISNLGFVFGVSAGSEPELQRVEAAARILGRAIRFVDADGYQREIFAAAINEQSGQVGYIETKAKQLRDRVDINIHVHIRAKDGREVVWEIVSYNPYFGCNVRLMEWFGDTFFMIYREKHSTYACRIGLAHSNLKCNTGSHWS